jgi:hypothetical protein
LDYTIRTESLEADLINMLEEFGYTLTDEVKDQIKNSGKTNVSSHLDSSHYYDKDTIELITHYERLIIDKYGYRPPIIKK